MQRDSKLIKAPCRNMRTKDLAKPRRRDQVIAATEKTSKPTEQIGGENIAPTHADPDIHEASDTFVKIVRSEPCAIHRTDRGPNDEVRADPLADQGPKHPRLNRSEIPAPGQHERGTHPMLPKSASPTIPMNTKIRSGRPACSPRSQLNQRRCRSVSPWSPPSASSLRRLDSLAGSVLGPIHQLSPRLMTVEWSSVTVEVMESARIRRPKQTAPNHVDVRTGGNSLL